ncbi:MAG: hypothetical protein II306_05760, partial [Clostridia bacterium]|nr:hypothetical protein [Clostridia bacterium]
LQYGLDPNYVFGEIPNETNALFEIYWIDKPFVAADTLKLLLEHGGDPHLEVGGESIWMTSDFDIWFDVINGYAAEDFFKHTFESHFYFWLVLRGFIYPEEEEYKEYTLFAYKLIEKELTDFCYKVC